MVGKNKLLGARSKSVVDSVCCNLFLLFTITKYQNKTIIINITESEKGQEQTNTNCPDFCDSVSKYQISVAQ